MLCSSTNQSEIVPSCLLPQARKEVAKGYGYEDQGNDESSDDEIRVSCACAGVP